MSNKKQNINKSAPLLETSEKNMPPTMEYRIAGMDIIKINFDFGGIDINNSELVEGKFGYKMNYQGGTDSNLKCIVVAVNVDTHLISTPDNILSSISVRYAYFIENYDEVVIKKEDDSEYLDPAYIQLFNGISTSTTRGVMFVVHKGTPLHNAILPIVNVANAETRRVAPPYSPHS